MSNSVNSVVSILQSPEVEYTKNLFTSQGSIMKLLNPFIVEPTVFVSNSLRSDTDLVYKAVSEQVDIFCCFYSMAFKVLNELAGTSAGIHLKKLGTHGNSITYGVDTGIQMSKVTASKLLASKESYHQFVSNRKYNGSDIDQIIFSRSGSTLSGSLESINSNVSMENKVIRSLKEVKDNIGYGTYTRFFELGTTRIVREIQFDKKTGQIEKDPNGNPIYKKEEKQLSIPITVRAHVVFVDTEDLMTVFDVKKDENNFFQRYHKWRSGGISFKEFILATDLIQEYRTKKLENKNVILDILNGKSANATITAIGTNGVRGYEKFYNLFVISSSDMEYIERSLRGEMKNERFSQSVLEKLQAMEFMVIDQDYNVCEMYLHTLPKPSTFPVSKLGGRKENSDLSELMKALYANQRPSF